jgi:hypothetical protein
MEIANATNDELLRAPEFAGVLARIQGRLSRTRSPRREGLDRVLERLRKMIINNALSCVNRRLNTRRAVVVLLAALHGCTPARAPSGGTARRTVRADYLPAAIFPSETSMIMRVRR